MVYVIRWSVWVIWVVWILISWWDRSGMSIEERKNEMFLFGEAISGVAEISWWDSCMEVKSNKSSRTNRL